MAGYHLNEIEKGVVGEFSKITEEYLELEDAVKQNVNILILTELTDLYGAIECYINKHFSNLTMEDIKKFSKLTQKAFEEGKR